MSFRSAISFIFVAAVLCAYPSMAQRSAPATGNAALRYWSAFSAMRDSAISSDQAAELNAVLAGRAEYDDSKFKDLVEKNKIPLEIMARATALPECNWGLDYSLGSDEPVEYARNALALGRLNVLYTLHLIAAGNQDAAVSALAAGLRFSRDVANGGTLFATLVSDQLISEHLRAIPLAKGDAGFSAAQRLVLQKAIASLGPDGLDWRSAVDHEFQVGRGFFPGDAQASAALTRVDSAYVKALKDPSALPALQDAIHKAPPAVAQLIPNLAKVVEKKESLAAQIAQTRSYLR